MTKPISRVVVCATLLTAMLVFPLVSQAALTKTCLTGTAPEVGNDATQIRALRALVDGTCVCSNFDGSKGKAHGDYVKCAVAIINAQAAVPPGNLRTQCKGTVKKFYAKSTCGMTPALHAVPCIKTVNNSGKVICTIRPTTKCTNGATFTQLACPAYTACIDAADTNGNLVIGAPGDSGMCVPTPTSTPTVTPTSTPTVTPTETPTTAPLCTPETCSSLHFNCGPAGDGCGNLLNCGSCPLGQTCGGGGLNTCGNGTCTPQTCVSLGFNCGLQGDGCGNVINCGGGCPVGQTCGGGGPGKCG